MLIDLFQESWKALHAISKDKKHPFNTCTLATIGENSTIKQRTVILRGVTESNSLLIYTDLRSKKVKHLKKNPKASLLFYDPKIQLQLVLEGEILVHTNDRLWEKHKNKIEGNAVNNYNSQIAPGKAILNPMTVDRVEKLHFGLLEFIPYKMQYLKLKEDSNHIRAKFQLKEGTWKKTFLVP